MKRYILRQRFKIINLLITIVILLSMNGRSLAQENQDSTKIFTVVETMPEFPGGTDRMFKIIKDSIQYPAAAMKDRVGGKVYVTFTIDTTGNVTDVKIARGIREDIDNEAMRLVKLLNGWKPGTQNGKNVKVIYNLPVTFYPDKKWKREYEKEMLKKK